ncbi:MAG: cysteine--tRNA ligase, partial [Desulfobulbaceae bacterium]|nr:cysteine--tRNA ligase [Desulfobulbaceae bacterium]
TISDEKMSKSLNNFLTIRDVLANYSPEVLRLLIFSTQYRNPLDFSETVMNEAVAGLDRMYECLAKIMQLPEGGPDVASVVSKKDMKKIESLELRFQQAMDNDFNTAQALGNFFDLVKILNKIMDAMPSLAAAGDVELLRSTGKIFRDLLEILGILRLDPVEYIRKKKQDLLAAIDLSEEDIAGLIKKRAQAREAKDWAAGDAIRDTLLERNIELKDGSEGTTWDVKL